MDIKRRLILFNIIVVIITGVIFVSAQNKKTVDVARLRCGDCNVILIGIDTLRADHLGSYGYFRNTSPNIDKFAENGVLFQNTFSHSSKTTPSFMSILTSLYPTDHGVLDVLTVDSGFPIVKINEKVKTLPQILKANGYKTYAIVNTANIPPEMGFDRGFDEFTYIGDNENRESLLGLLPRLDSEKFFIFFHDQGSHGPYVPQQPYDTLYVDPSYSPKISIKEYTEAYQKLDFAHSMEDSVDTKRENSKKVNKLAAESYWGNVDTNDPRDIEYLKALYDGEIKYLDDFIGRLQKALIVNNLLENTIIIFTSDHGEEFYEHGVREHNQLYNEVLHVPLIFHLPAIKEKIEISSRVRSVDIMPTVLDLLNIELDYPLRGISLLPHIVEPKEKEDLPVVSTQFKYKTPEHSFMQNDRKVYLKNESEFDTARLELYNLTADPLEKDNTSNKETAEAEMLKTSLQAILNDSSFIYTPTPLTLDLDTERQENLKSLGY